jgi:hypothetical protein
VASGRGGGSRATPRLAPGPAATEGGPRARPRREAGGGREGSCKTATARYPRSGLARDGSTREKTS